jgi:transcriptional regulator with XRE-family HTH domain
MPLINHYERASISETPDEVASFNKNIGTLLKQARIDSSLSQEIVGEKLGLSQDSISKYENGSAVTAFKLLKFSKLYRKPISFFYMTTSN